MRVLAQDGRRAERLTPCAPALRRGVDFDFLDQPRDQLPIHLGAEVTPAGELRELDGLFRRMAPELGVLSPQLVPVLRGPVEPGARHGLAAQHVFDQAAYCGNLFGLVVPHGNRFQK